MDARLERQARNEALTRTVNQRRATLDENASAWAEPSQRFEFMCECGCSGGCDSRIEMTLAEYEQVRGQSDRFAVVPGHETEAIERVVERDRRFLVVDKRRPFEPLLGGAADEATRER